jgi:undecaprenyl-diphosphatase
MNGIEAIILGLVQGLTEFIPVSSSGHLVLFQHLFGLGQDHLFLEWINIGTFAALLVYFRHKIVRILRDIFEQKKYTLARNILLTSVPAGIVGFMLSDFINTAPFFSSLITVMCTLAAIGIVMIVLEKLPKYPRVRSAEALPPNRALAIGLAQMFALIPGVSRSGSTIIAGRLAGMNAAMAAEYSFLASLPIMAGVTLKNFAKDLHYLEANFAMLALANVVAFASGLLAVGFLMRYLAKHNLAVFGWYRVGLAAIIAVVLLLQLGQ